MYDSLQRLTGAAVLESPPNGNAGPAFDPRRAAFLARWPAAGRAAGEYQGGVLQALQMLNGDDTARATLPDQSSLMASLSAPLFSQEERLESLFLATLGRYPTPDEAAPFLEHLNQAQEPTVALGDILWALVNSAEFAFNH